MGNQRKYDRLGKSLQERNTILWDFPNGEIILGVLETPCTPQKSKWAAARTTQTRPYTGNKWKTYQDRTLPKNEFFGGKWREYGRNSGKYDRLGKSLQERARLNTILWDFPREEIILEVVEISCTSQKSKSAAARTIQPAQKLEKKWKTYQNRTLPKKKFFGGKWREYGRNNGKYDRLGKSLQERARLNTIPWDFPREEIILGVLEILCTPQKSKWAAASWKKNKHRMLSLSQSFPPSGLWKETKGMWEKCGEVWKNGNM